MLELNAEKKTDAIDPNKCEGEITSRADATGGSSMSLKYL